MVTASKLPAPSPEGGKGLSEFRSLQRDGTTPLDRSPGLPGRGPSADPKGIDRFCGGFGHPPSAIRCPQPWIAPELAKCNPATCGAQALAVAGHFWRLRFELRSPCLVFSSCQVTETLSNPVHLFRKSCESCEIVPSSSSHWHAWPPGQLAGDETRASPRCR